MPEVGASFMVRGWFGASPSVLDSRLLAQFSLVLLVLVPSTVVLLVGSLLQERTLQPTLTVRSSLVALCTGLLRVLYGRVLVFLTRWLLLFLAEGCLATHLDIGFRGGFYVV